MPQTKSINILGRIYFRFIDYFAAVYVLVLVLGLRWYWDDIKITCCVVAERITPLNHHSFGSGLLSYMLQLPLPVLLLLLQAFIGVGCAPYP